MEGGQAPRRLGSSSYMVDAERDMVPDPLWLDWKQQCEKRKPPAPPETGGF